MSLTLESVTTTVDTQEDIEQYRREIGGYCYRMLGSVFEADDATQETMLKAWRSIDRFEGRSSLRTWLYRIATNVCLDMLRTRPRREQPMDMGPSSPADERLLGPMLSEHPWLLPMPDGRSDPDAGYRDDPAAAVVGRESIRLAFVAALQHLPPRQRAVLILREVLAWPAEEVSTLLDTSVASVNSALQRARATMASRDLESLPTLALPSEHADLLASFVEAFERYDMTRIAELLRDDVMQNMPPFAMWLRGKADILAWMQGPGFECEGSRMVATWANGCAAFGQYRRAETFGDPRGGHLPWGLQVIEISDSEGEGPKISQITNFLNPELFPAFGLPAYLEAS